MFIKENNSLWMTYVVSALFGTWPLYPTNVHSMNNENQVTSTILRELITWFRRYTMCTVWLMLSVCSHIYYVIQPWIYSSHSKSTNEESKYEEIAKILLVTENWTFNLAAIINISTTYFTSKKVPSMLHRFDKVEKWIESLKGKRRTSKIQKDDLKRFLAWLLSIYFVIFITMGVEYSGLLSIHRDGNFLSIIFQDLGKLSMTTYDLQFSTLCISLKNRFQYLNKILKKIHHSNPSTYQHPKLDRNSIRRIRFIGTIKQYPSVAEINKLHIILCDIIIKMNSIYQIQIALNFAVCFFNTVSVLFTTISEYRANTDWTLWISGLLWVTYYILRVIMVCTSASAAIEQAFQSRTHLSNINNRNLEGKKKYQVELFAQRLANTDIKFILLNLMTINTTFLSSAGVVVTTYLVILNFDLQRRTLIKHTRIMNPRKHKDVFFRSFSVAYYFSKIFGAMPFKIDKTNTSNAKKNRWCRVGITFSIIYIVLVFLSMGLTKQLSSLTKFKGKKLLTIHDKTQMIVAPMFLWSVFISQVFIIASFVLLPIQLGELNVVFQKFRRMANSPDGILLFGNGDIAEKMVNNVTTNTWRVVIFYIFLAVTSAISSFNRIRLSASVTFVVMLDVVTKKMEALSVCIEFCAICDILLHCFYSINENLSALKYRRRELQNQSVHPTLNEILPPTHEIIKSMGRCHAQLCDIIEQVNKIYQIQNLFGIVVCTLKMLPHLFLTGIILTYSNFRIVHSSFFLWPAQYLYRVFILCESATKVTNEAMKTYTHVSALYDQDIDENSKQEVVLFMERINNRSIQFSLCGLCKLDNECFFSNLVTVGGFFIIILQSYMTQIENWPTEIHSEWI